MKSKSPITDSVIEECMQNYPRTNMSIKLTGTRWGPSIEDWSRLMLNACQEYRQKLPRCVRNMNWNSEKRLQQINEVDDGIINDTTSV